MSQLLPSLPLSTECTQLPLSHTAQLSAADLFKLGFLAAIWGASFIFLRLVVPETGSLLAASLRIILAAIALLLFSAIKQIPLDWKRNFKPYVLVGLFGAVLPFALYAYAAQYLPAALSALFNATSPLFSALFAILWLSEQPTIRKLSGLLLGILGVLLLVGNCVLMHTHPQFSALTACVIAPACFAISATIIKHSVSTSEHQRIHPIALATGSMTMAAAMLLPCVPFALPTHAPSSTAIILIIALALLPSALAQIIFIPLIGKIGTTRAMSVSFLIPLFSLLWGFIFLQETIQLSSLAGGLLVLLATWITLKP